MNKNEKQITQDYLIKRGKDEMSSMKIESFIREFSWIKKYVARRLSEVYVSKISQEIIDYRLNNVGWNNDYIFLLNHLGNLVTGRTKDSVCCRGGVVKYMLEDIGCKAKLVRFILSYHEYTNAVIVFKVPENTYIPEWIEQQMQVEQQRVRKEYEQIG